MRSFTRASLGLAILLSTTVATAQYVPVSLLVDGDLLPSGGLVQNVGPPSVNASGQVAFEGDDDQTEDDFLWVDGVEVIRAGDVLVGSIGTVNDIAAFDNARRLNASASVAWEGTLSGTAGGTADDEFLAIDTTILMIEDTIYPAVDAVGNPGGFNQIAIDDAGNVIAEVELDDVGTTANEVLVRIPAGGSPAPLAMNLISVFREGALIAGGPLDTMSWETSVPFSGLSINGSGTILVEGDLDEGTLVTTSDDKVLIRKAPGSDYELLLREGDTVTPIVGPAAQISDFLDLSLASNGDWAAELDTSGATAEDNVIIADLLGSGPVVVAQEGQDIGALTGFPGTTIGLINGLQVNGVGQVVFFAAVNDDGANIPPYSEAMFRYEAGTISLLMTNDVLIANIPATPMTDFEGNDLAINDAGDIVFQGDANSTTLDAIFRAFLPSVFAVEQLVCSVDPLAPDVVEATWVNPQAYDGIRVFVDGVLVSTLGGTETSFLTAPVTAPANLLVELEPFVGIDNGPLNGCSAIAIVPPDATECSTPAAVISNSAQLFDTLTVTTNALLDDASILLDITHPNQADLDIQVTTPGGTTIVLSTDNGGSNDDVLTTFADFGAPIGSNLNDSTYTQPEGPGSFADLRCELSAGDWVLDIFDDLSSNDGTLNQWCLNIYASVGDPDCCPRPNFFACANVGACGGPGVELNWGTPGLYSLLQLVRDDGVNPPVTIPLAANATGHSDAGVVAGTTYTYTLQYVCDGGAAVQDAATCIVAVDATTVLPVTDLVLVSDFCGSTVTVTWNTNGVPYDTVLLFRGATQIADVTGLSSFVDNTPASGTYTVVASCGAQSSPATESVDHSFGSVTDLACTADGLGGVELTWTNNDAYTVLQVERNGVLLASQPTLGDSSFTDTAPETGCNTYTLTAGCASFSESVTCVIAFFDPFAPLTETVLMIPDSVTDTIGLYSKECGAYIGDLIDLNTLPAPAGFGLAQKAILGPDDQIYVSDQTDDQVLRFTREGVFVDVFASNASSSIDNVRGIAFQGTDLLVSYDGTTAGNEGVVRIDSAGVSQGLLFVRAGMWDIIVLDDGTFLTTNITDDDVLLYSADGLASTDLLIPNLSFPEQISATDTNTFLVTEFTNDLLIEFDINGTVSNSWDIGDAGTPRGNAKLTNGTYLVTGSNGVFSLDPVSGTMTLLRDINGYMVGELPPTIIVIEEQFIRGDTNNDGTVNIADAIFVLGNLFPGAGGQTILVCDDAADCNDDGTINIADAISLLGSLFGSPAVPLPLPNIGSGCGIDPTDGDALDCAEFGTCP